MEQLKNDGPYYYRFINADGWIIGLHRVMFGTRVVIYHDKQKFSINGDFCGGDNPEMVRVLFNTLYRWIATLPDNVPTTCHHLHKFERKRPFGNDIEFMYELTEIEKIDISFDHPDGIFELKPITVLG